MTVAAAEDAYASQGTPNTTHGGLAYVAVNAPTGERRTYLKFAVAGVPANATNLTASLRLWAESSSSAMFTAYRAPTTWTESALTWNNQPSLGTVITNRAGVTSAQYNGFDVTPHVTGNGTWAVALTASTSAQVKFTAREATTSHPPQLTLSWTTSATTSTSTTSSTTTTTTSGTTTTQPDGSDPVLAAAGDIACAPGVPATATTCHHAATSDLIVDSNVTAVQLLGDNQYDGGALADYNASYDPTWGRAKAKTHPAPGNHEYGTPGAAGYFSYFGAAAGDPAKGYYSYDLGAWHVVVLNSEIAHDAGSAQVQWLRDDLAASPTACTLAVWHRPRFTSGGTHGPDISTAPFWQVLYDAGAEIALAGHEHSYERFAPQRPDATSDPERGIREFVVGSGGKTHYGFTTPAANSEVRNGTTFGVLKLTLHPTSYDWQFVPEAGQNLTDTGAGSCH